MQCKSLNQPSPARNPGPGTWIIVAQLTGMLLAACASTASAKEEHFEKVKFELLQVYVQCTTCHPDDKGDGLTRYGQRLADMGKATSVQERMRRMERRVSDVIINMDPHAEDDRVDIDGDNVLNWVEILSGTDPSDPSSVPKIKPSDEEPNPIGRRIQTVIDCKLCHTSVDTTGPEDKAPHNPFGESIAKLDAPPPGARPGARPGAGNRAPPAQPQPTDFLKRFRNVANQDLDKDKTRNWEEIATFHAPSDPNDFPTKDEIENLKVREALIRRLQAGFGRQHKE